MSLVYFIKKLVLGEVHRRGVGGGWVLVRSMKQQFALFVPFHRQGKYAAAPFPLSLGPKSEVPIYLARGRREASPAPPNFTFRSLPSHGDQYPGLKMTFTQIKNRKQRPPAMETEARLEFQ